MIRRFAMPLFFALSVMVGGAWPVAAETDNAEPRRPGEVARERVHELLRSLEKFVAGLPRYGVPEITENGDIVIPRVGPKEERPSVKQPAQPDVLNL